MPMQKLKLRPGVNVLETPTLNEAGISFSNLIRFYGGLPQKRGGWLRMVDTPLIGRCCGLHGWADIFGVPYLAAGTEQRLELYDGGMLVDITPIVATENPAVAFSTTIGTNVVTINDTMYSPSIGDWIMLLTQVSVGGLVLYGYERVTNVVDSSHYQVTTGSALATATVVNGGAVPTFTTTTGSATITVTLANHGLSVLDIFPISVSTTVSTVVLSGPFNVVSVISPSQFTINGPSLAAGPTTVPENGGNARIEYLLPSGALLNTFTGGYGLGDYGAGDYGLANVSLLVPARVWSLDNFGQDLIASPTQGAIYYWQPTVVQPASVISSTAPIYNQSIFVMSQAEMIVAIGAEVMGTQEPLLVRWCDAGDFTDWTPTVSNQAGSFTIPQGSTLVGGLSTGLGALLWTDVGLYQMTYIGLPFVFGFRPVATGCGLIGVRAFAVVGSNIMWLSVGTFFIMPTGGSPQPIECPIWDVLINNWDLTNPNGFVMGANSLTNEFEMFAPLLQSSPYYSAGVMEYLSAKYNYVENVWDYTFSSQLQGTAWEKEWTATGQTIGNPVRADLAGLLQQHEVGMDADGQAMQWSWQTGEFDIANGEEMVFMDWIIPDFATRGNPTISITPFVQEDPNDTPLQINPIVWTPTTKTLPNDFGARGRQMALKFSGNDLGTFNRLGAVRYRVAPDGRGF